MYIIVFIITIPILLYKFKFITFLKLYFLNTDQVATVISFHEGAFKHIFKYIYNDTGPFMRFISIFNQLVSINGFILCCNNRI